MHRKQPLKKYMELVTSNKWYVIKANSLLNQITAIFTDKEAEAISAITNDTHCCGSAGSGWDNMDKGEVKFTSHVQSKKCKGCGEKIEPFSQYCHFCNSPHFTINKGDGRWGIGAVTHFKHYDDLNEYRLIRCKPLSYDHSNRAFEVEYWTLAKDSEYFNMYAQIQMDTGKANSVNFQPEKRDFYLSEPVSKWNGILSLSPAGSNFEFTNYDMENTTPVKIPDKFKNADMAHVIESKNMAKKRGKTTRN